MNGWIDSACAVPRRFLSIVAKRLGLLTKRLHFFLTNTSVKKLTLNQLCGMFSTRWQRKSNMCLQCSFNFNNSHCVRLVPWRDCLTSLSTPWCDQSPWLKWWCWRVRFSNFLYKKVIDRKLSQLMFAEICPGKMMTVDSHSKHKQYFQFTLLWFFTALNFCKCKTAFKHFMLSRDKFVR